MCLCVYIFCVDKKGTDDDWKDWCCCMFDELWFVGLFLPQSYNFRLFFLRIWRDLLLLLSPLFCCMLAIMHSWCKFSHCTLFISSIFLPHINEDLSIKNEFYSDCMYMFQAWMIDYVLFIVVFELKLRMETTESRNIAWHWTNRICKVSAQDTPDYSA